MQKGVVFALGLLTGVIAAFLWMFIFAMITSISSVESDIETEQKSPITMFEKPADCVSKGHIEIQEVLEPSVAIARTQSNVINGEIWYHGKEVVVTNNNDKTYYDKQEIKAPHCFRQVGIYKSKYGNSTLPVVIAE